MASNMYLSRSVRRMEGGSGIRPYLGNLGCSFSITGSIEHRITVVSKGFRNELALTLMEY